DQGCAAGACVPACEAAAASHGNVGCDFLVPTPKPFYWTDVGSPTDYTTEIQPCFAVFVANAWDLDAPIHVERGGTTYDASAFGRIAESGKLEEAWEPIAATGIPPGKVGVLFLSDDSQEIPETPVQCPVAPALRQAGGSLVPITTTPDHPIPVTGKG